MANRVLEQIDQRIESLERKLAALKSLRDAAAQDPDFITTVQDILLDPGSNALPSPERAVLRRHTEAPYFERIIHVLLANNRPLSIREIADRTKLARMAITNVLYNGDRKQYFEKLATSEKRFTWRVVANAPSFPDFPESCLPLIDRLVAPSIPVLTVDESEKNELEPEKTPPTVIPIRRAMSKAPRRSCRSPSTLQREPSRRRPTPSRSDSSTSSAC